MNWLDAWGVARRWPCGQPAGDRPARTASDSHPGHRAMWAREI